MKYMVFVLSGVIVVLLYFLYTKCKENKNITVCNDNLTGINNDLRETLKKSKENVNELKTQINKLNEQVAKMQIWKETAYKVYRDIGLRVNEYLDEENSMKDKVKAEYVTSLIENTIKRITRVKSSDYFYLKVVLDEYMQLSYNQKRYISKELSDRLKHLYNEADKLRCKEKTHMRQDNDSELKNAVDWTLTYIP